MCNIDLEPCAVWETTEQRARKEYRCDECFSPIPKGARYARTGHLLDGSWGTYRRHVECVALADFVVNVVCAHESGGLAVGELEDELRQYDGDPMEPGEPTLLDLYHCIRDSYAPTT